ncbi:MAG: phenylacetate--CoA ligase family protein [Acidobacteria bacterium ACB1]|nr:hypothetical protein [Pyrinomonadaceae bacterium]MCE7962956.1 phenylacetate--CoA ligase family protein [Acidobacteria bacterium ACB1]RIJ89826.1 MAG: hypothetical protein DCC44_11510 [Acidobacteriota bacterium]
MSVALDIYNMLPAPARSAAASLRGHYLNRWRYGSETESLVQAALNRESWSEAEWKTWRTDRLAYVLERAATRVPFYRRAWAERRRRGDNSSWGQLKNWDVLEKESVRANPLDFVADDLSPNKMFHDHTSGTTGTSLSLYMTKETVRQWYALFEARSRRWYGVSRHDRWAILGGQLVTPVGQKKPPFWVWNSGLHQLYMSSYHLTPQNIPAYIDALAKFGVRYILGYPSAVYTVAAEALRIGRQLTGIDVVILNAEPVYDYQREAIAKAFNCPVRATYGMAEVVAAGGECEYGRLHQWPEAGIIESGTDVGDGLSDLVCTGLMNADMPLIRYRVGDSGKVSNEKCECGRTLPVIEKISGRTDDILLGIDGQHVGRMDPVFKGGLPIKEAQIVQNSVSTITVNYVPADDFHDAALVELTTRIRERLGRVDVDFKRMTSIPRTSRGKFRAVICNVDPQAAGSGRFDDGNGR